ncbi:hypothetical protein AMELA_G00186470 [Ameiurus melas]|uniref:Uncharacterized protein n=1 Tax=Ameiurus melas TaxID=219545 RepID=A0A7J6A9X6_AMEME|nr:hypothetical protein AMELA_G00186470 [Ameiurus melas]
MIGGTVVQQEVQLLLAGVLSKPLQITKGFLLISVSMRRLTTPDDFLPQMLYLLQFTLLLNYPQSSLILKLFIQTQSYPQAPVILLFIQVFNDPQSPLIRTSTPQLSYPHVSRVRN